MSGTRGGFNGGPQRRYYGPGCRAISS